MPAYSEHRFVCGQNAGTVQRHVSLTDNETGIDIQIEIKILVFWCAIVPSDKAAGRNNVRLIFAGNAE